jgi:hypothetical protein
MQAQHRFALFHEGANNALAASSPILCQKVHESMKKTLFCFRRSFISRKSESDDSVYRPLKSR